MQILAATTTATATAIADAEMGLGHDRCSPLTCRWVGGVLGFGYGRSHLGLFDTYPMSFGRQVRRQWSWAGVEQP